MHGIIFVELRKYVVARLGARQWSAILEDSGVETKVYLPIRHYPDDEAVRLVAAVAKATGKPAGEILEDYGEFIAPDLIGWYGALIRPTWKTLDLIENTEATIHTVVRIDNPGALPPELKCRRLSPNEVVISYTSHRKMCGIAKGIAKGLAKHFNEQVIIREDSCMLQGRPSCEISVTRT